MQHVLQVAEKDSHNLLLGFSAAPAAVHFCKTRAPLGLKGFFIF
jgi:hypothetical protein